MKYFPLIISLLFLISCGEKEKDLSYVQSHTTDHISRADNIEITFNNPIGKNLKDLNSNALLVIPSVSGDLSWKNDYTLQFNPNNYLEPGMKYQFKLSPRYLNLENKAVLDFTLRTKSMFIEYKEPFFRFPDESDRDRIELILPIESSDVLDSNLLYKSTSLNISGIEGNYEYRWQSGPSGLDHQLIVNDLRRKDEELKLNISLNSDYFNTTQDLNTEFSFPVPSDFEVIRVQADNENNTELNLVFSQPLKQKDFAGLVYFDGIEGDYSYELEGNILKVFLNKRLEGNHKVIIESSIESVFDVNINRIEKSIAFESIPPGLRLSQSGNILPDGKNLLFPFEVVGLNAIYLEIVEIEGHNMNQFLQVNNLEDNNEIVRVGEVVAREKVNLYNVGSGKSANKWSQYAIDLSDYIDSGKKSIYQVIISFKPSYTTLSCNNEATDEYEDDPWRYGRSLNTMLDLPYYGMSSRSEYDYGNRDNPCHGEYYRSSRFIWQNVLSSDIGLTAKKEANGNLHIAAISINKALPQSSVKVSVFDYQNSVIKSGVTNQNGVVTFDMSEIEDEPFLIFAERGKDRNFLKIVDENSLEMSRFNTAGKRVEEGMKGFLYAERGVWRPGDSIYLSLMLENKLNEYEAPAHLEVFDPRGKLAYEKKAIKSFNGIYPLAFSTSESDPTGTYSARVSIGNTTFTKSLSVESIKPNRLKINIDKSDVSVDFKKSNKMTFPIETAWLHGGIASGMKYVSEINFQEVNYTSDAYSSYSFSDEKISRNSTQTVKKGQTDEKGNAFVSADVISKDKYAGAMQINIDTRVFEESGEYSIDKTGLLKYPYDEYVGIRDLNASNNYSLASVGDNVQFEAIVTDTKDNKLGSRNLDVSVYKVNWNWWWENSSGTSNVSQSSSHRLLDQFTVESTSNGNAEINYSPQESGRYYIKVCHNEGHCTSSTFYAVNSQYYERAQFKNAKELPLNTDKENYLAGDNIDLILQAKPGQKALITVETGSEVLETRIHKFENEEETISIETSAEYAPGVYIYVSLVQARDDLTEDLPLRRYGLIYREVKDENAVLEPELSTKEQFEPNREYTIDVSEANGREMSYELMIVDEGLLDLTQFRTPNPLDYFRAKEGLLIKTWDNYDEIMGPYQKSQRLIAVGGGAKLDYQSEEQLSRFEAVAIHKGPFYLSENSSTQHKIKIPNYIGSVRVMLVARHNDSYGSVDKAVPVKKDLMVLGTAARRLGTNEEMVLPVTIFANSDNVKNVTVNIEDVRGNYNFPDGNTKNVQFSSGESQKTVYFRVQSLNKLQMSPLKINASSGALRSFHDINMPIIYTKQDLREESSKIIQPGTAATFPLEEIGVPGTQSSKLIVSSTFPPRLNYYINNVLRYPYGCNEQTASSAFAAVLATEFYPDNTEKNEQIKEIVNNSISSLEKKQLSSGAWSLWGTSDINPWVTSYIGHFLYYAQDNAYSVSDKVVDNFLKYQKKAVAAWSPNLSLYGNSRNISDFSQAYRLYTLALWRQPKLSEMNRLADSKSLSHGARLFLAAAYSITNYPDKASELLENSSGEIEGDNSYFNSSLRNLAISVILNHQVGKDSDANRAFSLLQDAVEKRRWMSTQEVVYTLIAIRDVYGGRDTEEETRFSYAVNNAERKTESMSSFSKEIDLDLKKSSYGSGKMVSVSNNSNAPIIAALHNKAQNDGIDRQESKGITIKNEYFYMNDEPADLKNLKSGTDLLVKTTVERKGALERKTEIEQLVVSQVFPSSWQILGYTDRKSYDKKTQSNYIYKDVRDDRVNTSLDLYRNNDKFVIITKVNVTYAGKYYLPSSLAETMYSPDYYAQTAGSMIEVVRE